MNFKGFSLIKSERRLLFGDVQIKLNPKAFDLLVFFAERAGKVLTKDEILRGLWHDSAVEEGNLPVQVAKIRKALRHHSDVSIIETIPGLGYCFATKVVSADRPRRSADGDIIRRVNIVRGTEVVAGTRRGKSYPFILCRYQE